MRFQDLVKFKSFVNKSNASLYVILIAEEAERKVAEKIVLEKVKGKIVSLEGNHFSRSTFTQETETLSFIENKIVIHISFIESLKKEDLHIILAYLENPSPWIVLLLSGKKVSTKLSSFAEKRGVFCAIKEKKVWEKEQEMVLFLKERAAQFQIDLSSAVALKMIHRMGMDHLLLQQELDKLLCYVGEEKELLSEAIEELTPQSGCDTLWQLGEAIFHLQTCSALKILRKIPIKEGNVFSLLSHLRSQVHHLLSVDSLYHQGGLALVKKEFPYLKAPLVEKKVAQVSSLGKKRLQQMVIALFHAELKARNDVVNDSHVFLESLIIQLTTSHASYSFT